ncbi:MAG: N-acetyldiaminopimelate deacetylase [Acidobacteria bacterium]|nr:N-acetyldiaminopimelate deacetylase [Acidobacteriota bacterium]
MARKLAVFLIFLLAAAMRLNAEDPQAWARANLDSLVSLYRHFHSHPELSLQEKETSAWLAAELKSAGFDVTTGIGGYGLVGLLNNGDGPVLMLRTDMDALPVTEKTGLAYASKIVAKMGTGEEVGVMHACGHDLHMTNLVGAARYLAANKQGWRGTLMVIGQPAEERGEGAKAMLDDGLFTRFPKPDFALALHVDAKLAAGRVGYCPGFSFANVDTVDITMHGKGGHGAAPQMTIDPVVQASELVMALQTIVSREIKPGEPAVVTVGSIHGGSQHNIISDSCHLQLTVRSYSEEVRAHLLEAIKRKANSIAAGARAKEPTVVVSVGLPSLWNDEKLTGLAVQVFKRALGNGNVLLDDPWMGGEDFSRYGRAGVPIFMYMLGTTDPKRLESLEKQGQTPHPVHSSYYYPDVDEALVTGITTMTQAAIELLKRQ